MIDVAAQKRESCMTRVTIDAATWSKLQSVGQVAELCDESGRIVGTFHPGAARDPNGKMIVPFTDEEIAELSKQETGRPLKDILNDLSAL
jgi:hypothetical protein